MANYFHRGDDVISKERSDIQRPIHSWSSSWFQQTF